MVLNEARWIRGAQSFEGDDLFYRQYLINPEVGHGIGYEHGFVNLVADMCRSIGAKSKAAGRFLPDFEDALKTQQVLDAVLLSAKQRRWVKISEMK